MTRHRECSQPMIRSLYVGDKVLLTKPLIPQSANEGYITQDYLHHADYCRTMRVHYEPLKPIDDDKEAERTNNLMSSAMIPKKTRSMGQWHSEKKSYPISAQSHTRMRMREPK